MSQSELKPASVTLSIMFADASNLPIHHVNALSVRTGSDEFFLTLGVATPPDQSELPAIMEAGHLVAQPVFRFAVSRDTMEKFLTVMAGQYEQQTTLMNQLHRLGKEEVNGDD